MTGPAFVQVFLATMLIVAALAKALAAEQFRATLRALAFPGLVRRVAPVAVPAAELATATLLMSERFRFSGQLALVLLLASFAAATWRAIKLRNPVSCNCFGPLLPETFGSRTWVRISVLGGLDAFLFASRGPTGLTGASVAEWLSATTLSLGGLALYALSVALWEFKSTWAGAERR